jgi:hypothetical protein
MSTATKTTARTEQWAVLKAEVDPRGDWRLMVMATRGVEVDPVRATCLLTPAQIAELHLDETFCTFVDPAEDPCGCYAIAGSQYCAFHSSTTAGLNVR